MKRRLEAQLELLTSAAIIKKFKGSRAIGSPNARNGTRRGGFRLRD